MKKIIIFVLIAFIIGFISGAYFYAKILDKPEIVNNNKIKLKRNKTVNIEDLN